MKTDPGKTVILLVEDAAVMRKIEIKTLRSLGYTEVIEAVDGTEALQRLQDSPRVDLIISDWNMPNMDGFELLKNIRASENHRELPFLMATGQSDKKQENKAIDAGVSSFVAKPFNEDELKQKIEEALGLRAVPEYAVEKRVPRLNAEGKVVLKVAHIQITDHLILGVLKKLIESGEFTPEHFELETECMPGWNPVRNALEKNQVDAAFVLAPIAMDLFSYGVPIKLTLLAHKSGSIFVRNKNTPVTSTLEDTFRNKSFLIPHKLSVHHMLAHLFFKQIGLRAGLDGDYKKDVQFEVVAPIKMQEFMQNNEQSIGFMVAEPLGTKAIASGAAELQFLSSELWENHPCCVVAMQDEFIDNHTKAVFEFTDLLVRAGKYIERKPETAAAMGVRFLDPDKKLGLKVPILKNVLTEPKGIRTGDLFPDIDALTGMNRYMKNHMGIGSIIDLDQFVDTRFAENACRDRITDHQPAFLHDRDGKAKEILGRCTETKDNGAKSMLNLEGKYLSFTLKDQEYGIDILKIKEIIGMLPIRSMPKAPVHIKGVVNLRGKVIPVMDLRQRFGLGEMDRSDRNCIVVLESEIRGKNTVMGLAVDSVSEVMTIKSADVEPVPYFGTTIDTRHILAMAKVNSHIKLLLDIEHVLAGTENLSLAA